MIRNKFFEDPDGGYAKVGVKKNFDIAWKRFWPMKSRQANRWTMALLRNSMCPCSTP